MNEIMSDISYTNMRTMLKDCMTQIQTTVNNDNAPDISSGFQDLDYMIGGFEKGKVYVIGGRPCMGKEEFMLSMIEDIVIGKKIPVLLFSTNHMKADYIQRLLAICCEIPSYHLSQGLMERLEWERLDGRASLLVDAPLFIHDCLDLPFDELVETAKNCRREKGLRIIFIDCLQMINFTKEDENASERIAKVMHAMKQLARQIDVPIVVGSMLGRGVEYREGIEGKKPQLMDLANSSYIEGLADVVMMVHRPEYYHIYQDALGRDLHGRIEIIVKKNALKPLGSFLLEYNQDTGFVSEIYDRSASKPVSLEEFGTASKAIINLIDTFDLEELPF
ncbi:MAG: DnaB-like helicase C-terminal domain-containing protein [Prevotella sp.]|nr:DnaB-like helicase C-terminal domain-containing protein [Prevotella sp.]